MARTDGSLLYSFVLIATILSFNFSGLTADTASQNKNKNKKGVDETQSDIKSKGYSVPSELPTSQEALVAAEVEKFMKQREKQKRLKKKEEESEGVRLTEVIPKREGFSPREKGMVRPPDDDLEGDAADSVDTEKQRLQTKPRIPLTEQKKLSGGTFYYGSQTIVQDKIAPATPRDGSSGKRKKITIRPFAIDIHEVSNFQFMDFILDTGYITESELYGWSFVLDGQVSEDVREEVDGPHGYGRVKGSMHWLGVKQASWDRPYGLDSDINKIMGLPVVHVSYNDAEEYCAWAGRRLPTDKEWEFAARDSRSKQNYPWGDKYKPGLMNIWDGDEFPESNLLIDRYYGPAPVMTFGPSEEYGLYNMLGNVWEWVDKGKNPEKRTMRGGSFIDSADGKFNHQVLVSTRQESTGDSAATNVGFRCASDTLAQGSRKTHRPTAAAGIKTPPSSSTANQQDIEDEWKEEEEEIDNRDHIEL